MDTHFLFTPYALPPHAHTRHKICRGMARSLWSPWWRRRCLVLLLLVAPAVRSYLPPPHQHQHPPPSKSFDRRHAAANQHPPPSKSLDRRHAAATLASGVAVAWLGVAAVPSMPARAESGRGVPLKGLVNLLRIQGYLTTLKESLEDTLQRGETSAPPELNQQIKYIVNALHIRQSIDEAVALVEPGRNREAAQSAGRSGYEYLSQVVEFSAFDRITRPGGGKYAVLSSPERIEFAVKCLRAAGQELARFFSFFPPAVRDEAQGIYEAYFAPPLSG